MLETKDKERERESEIKREREIAKRLAWKIIVEEYVGTTPATGRGGIGFSRPLAGGGSPSTFLEALQATADDEEV